VTAHQSVEVTSAKMYAALKRRNYVTPTNYLETVSWKSQALHLFCHNTIPHPDRLKMSGCCRVAEWLASLTEIACS
jgi:hypothetical protein